MHKKVISVLLCHLILAAARYFHTEKVAVGGLQDFSNQSPSPLSGKAIDIHVNNSSRPQLTTNQTFSENSVYLNIISENLVTKIETITEHFRSINSTIHGNTSGDTTLRSAPPKNQTLNTKDSPILADKIHGGIILRYSSDNSSTHIEGNPQIYGPQNKSSEVEDSDDEKEDEDKEEDEKSIWWQYLLYALAGVGGLVIICSVFVWFRRGSKA